MILTILVLANTGILLFIAALHYYWAVGGEWLRNAAIPSNPEEKKVFNPGKLATLRCSNRFNFICFTNPQHYRSV
jgi:hypothetical protein